jgi:hypothetical protein
VVRWRYRPGQFQIPINSGTELVIDGFLRSGTTFAFTAFEAVQPRKVKVAHHVHAPAQAIAAVQAGIPAIVLIRDPREAALSLVVRLPHLSVRQALAGYLRFYGPLLPLRPALVVAPFQTVVSDFGSVIREVNRRFGTVFVEFAHTEENVSRVMALIEKGDRREFGDGIEFERAVGRPSEVRTRMKEAREREYRSPSLAGLRDRADRTYRAFLP